MRNKIKVLVVDDSIFFRKVLIDNLSKFESIEIVGYAINAMDADSKILKLKPDVVTLDVEMPKVNGIDFLKNFISKEYIPVVLVSSLSLNVFDALSAGAVDFVKKPDMQSQANISTFISDLVAKITIAAYAKVRPRTLAPALNTTTKISPTLNNGPSCSSTVIAIGASTGGTEATLTVLKDLPVNTPGIVVVQHMPAGFTKMYADRLNKLCKMEVAEAKNGDIIMPGKVLIAPGEFQMSVIKSGACYAVKCVPGEKVSGHCPSVDVLFNSVADTVKGNSVGIIMTGMGKDGAAGLLKMRKSGSYTIGQDKESCVVYGMPMVAFNIGAVAVQASCENISDVLLKHLNGKH